MGLTGALPADRRPGERVIALAGNPNVGKSTLFNALTGLRQHTGNWPGKTVECAVGRCRRGEREYVLADLPGTYSLRAHSAEEEVARDFLCFGGADAAVVVCDTTCLERSLILALQVMELQPRTVVCVNLLDEARRRGIRVDLTALEEKLGVPVRGTAAGRRQGLEELLEAVEGVLPPNPAPAPPPVPLLPSLERAAAALEAALPPRLVEKVPPRWAALRLLEGDGAALDGLAAGLGFDPRREEGAAALEEALAGLERAGLGREELEQRLGACLVMQAERVCASAAASAPADRGRPGGRLDRLLTSRATGIPLMLALLAGVLWLTIQGANYPSQLLSAGLFWVQDRLGDLFLWLGAPEWLRQCLVFGAFRVLAWVVSVMLPPMAIFFPLFTLLEDLGYLPRVAFVLDCAFQKARACGKQALTMCMGFGCNAAGVVGCRIIDSPRERLVAALTNSLVPCNGRFPTLIALLGVFFAGAGPWRGGVSALLLTGVLVLGVGATLVTSRLLSATLLRGTPSAFTLELPPCRLPRVGQVLARSVLDRTLFVLGRAAAVAAPAGLVIWVFANVQAGEMSLLARCAAFLDPFARALGLDGVILMAFLLGLPANEIVVPVMLMAYLSGGVLVEAQSTQALGEILTAQGWTPLTAACTILFCLFHWPCSTACLTIRRETGSWKWTALAVALPTGLGMGLCALVAACARALGLG